MDLNKVTFETWDHPTLVKFCYEAEAKLREQDDQLQQLQCDFKDAMNANRELMKRQQ